MFLDLARMGDPGGPWAICAGCGRELRPGEPLHLLRIDDQLGFGLDRLNGTYHTECARPLLSVMRALNALCGPKAR